MIGILGGNGYIGSVICAGLKAKDISFINLSRNENDYYQRPLLERWLEKNQITFLINSAGFTGRPNVDACEKQKAECLLGNAVLPGIVKEACQNQNVPLGHVSSGCIYHGLRDDGQPFTEQDSPNFCFRTNFCSFYSGTKALGEEVLSDYEQCYIWRLRIPFNSVDGHRNYLSKLLNYSRLLNVRNSLTNLDDFVKCCLVCIEQDVPYGIYNVTNGGSVTTKEVVEILKENLAPKRQFNFFEDEAEFMRDAAIAPRSNTVLDNQKALDAGLPLRPIRESLEDAVKNWRPKTPEQNPTAHSNRNPSNLAV